MHRSIIIAIMIAFKIVAIPGFCFKGIQKIKTIMLIINVINPTDKFVLIAIPWANTLQGEAPEYDTISNPSPNPKIISPKHTKNNDEIFGFRFEGLSELQKTVGIFFILRNIFKIVFTICLNQIP